MKNLILMAVLILACNDLYATTDADATSCVGDYSIDIHHSVSITDDDAAATFLGAGKAWLGSVLKDNVAMSLTQNDPGDGTAITTDTTTFGVAGCNKSYSGETKGVYRDSAGKKAQRDEGHRGINDLTII